jgi:hypothetical protein
LTGSFPEEYHKVRSIPALTILPVGSYPFEFCNPGTLALSPAERSVTGSLEIMLEDAAAFSADANVLTGMMEAVSEMSGLGPELITLTVSNGDGAQQAFGQEAPDVAEGKSFVVFSFEIPRGKPFAEVDLDFAELTFEKTVEIITVALQEANATVPNFINITMTPPGRVHAPQAGFCVDGYVLYDGVLEDNFGECAGSMQEGTCILPIADAMKVCASSSRCAGVVDTTDAEWLARHPEGVAGVGGLPLTSNGLWKSCVKPRLAAVASARPEELCTSINGTMACDSGLLVDNAAETFGNTSAECCYRDER